MYNSKEFEWCRGFTSGTHHKTQYTISPLIVDYLRSLKECEVVTTHGWKDASGFQNKYFTSAQLMQKKAFKAKRRRAVSVQFQRATDDIVDIDVPAQALEPK